MGRPAKYPQEADMLAFLDKHPGLTYPQLWELNGSIGTIAGFASAARRAGVERQEHRPPLKGGGPMDAMTDAEFWGNVDSFYDEHLKEKEDALRLQAEFKRASSSIPKQARAQWRSHTRSWGSWHHA